MPVIAPFDLAQFYRFLNVLKIDTKEQGVITLGKSLLGTQTWVVNEIAEGMENGKRNFVTLKCYHPSMRVLTAELKWKPIGALNPGDELVAFDENHHGPRHSRKMRTASVRAVTRSIQRSYTVNMSNGVQLIATADHRHLVKRRGGNDLYWKPVSWLKPGDQIRYITTPWEGEPTYEDGWYGGILDGEGYFDPSRDGCRVSASQTDGPVFDRMVEYLQSRGYAFSVERDKRLPGISSKLGSKPVNRLLVQRMNQLFRLIGVTRTSRFVNKRWWEGKDLPGKKTGETYATVESIEERHDEEMVDIETSTSTFICEGFCSHNCRQIGISTISLAFDMFWLFKHRAMTGALVTHDEPSRDQFRSTLDMYYQGLPDSYKYRRVIDNRNGTIYSNKSRLIYRVAGTRSKGGGALGRSAALAFLHATEMSSWGDPEGIKSLVASLAETNPLRFYHWESTARGFNHFYDMWLDAKKSVSSKAIFVSFWANDFYRAPRHSDVWKAYWGFKGRLTPDEREWVREVKALYNVDIDDTQIAWWRWKIAEGVGDEMMMMQEFPPTENHAFVATGSQFFTAASISQGYKLERTYNKPRLFRIQIGSNFSDTTLLATPEKLATLRVWEEPVSKGVYVLGADPAYGSSEWADRFCCSVWRCYADKLVQVAEFVDPDMATYSFAWVLAYLAGAYEPCLVNLEINGPGQGVLAELQSMRRAFVSSGREGNAGRDARTLMAVTKNITSYLYRRLDSLSGMPGAIHTKTSYDMKERMMNTMRDYYERGFLVVKSRGLLDEMKTIVREQGSAPGAPDRSKDDRVMAASLAVTAWNDQQRTRLLMQNATYDLVTKSESGGPGGVVDKLVSNYLSKIGINQQRLRR
jgi:hypothetical protein